MTQKKILLIMFLTAAILRLGLNIVREKVFFHRPFLYADDKIMTSDEVWYDRAARAFLKGKGILSMDRDTVDCVKYPAFRFERKPVDEMYYAHKVVPPLYPLFLALCYYIGGINTLAYFVPQLVLGCLTCIFIYFITKELFNVKTAVIAGFIVAFYPDLIFWTNLIRTENLFIFLLALGFLLIIKGNIRGSKFLIYISAVIFGLACLTRITFVPFLPFLFLWQIYFFKKNNKKKPGVSIVMILLIFTVLLPWCIRNYRVFGKFTPFTEEANSVLFIKELEQGKTDYPEAKRYYRLYDSVVLRAGIYIKDHFKEYLSASLKRFIVFWGPITSEMRPIARIYKSLTWIIVFPLAFWGMIISRKEWKEGGILVVFIVFHALLHAGSYVDGGLVYRYPIQPFLCIFTAYGFWNIYEKIKYKKSKENNHL